MKKNKVRLVVNLSEANESREDDNLVIDRFKNEIHLSDTNTHEKINENSMSLHRVGLNQINKIAT